MRLLLPLAVVFALTAPASAAPAAAGACNLKQLASIALFMGPRVKGVLMRATLNGVPKYLMINTDSDASMLSRNTALELGLVIRRPQYSFNNLGRRYAEGIATVENVGFGMARPQRVDFLIASFDFWPGAGDIVPAFRSYDVEFDFAAGRMNLFEPSSCIAGPYWPNNGAAALDIDIAPRGRMRVPMMLDGKRVKAAFNTAFPGNYLHDATARERFGVDPRTTHFAALKTLSTENGEITINNPRLTLVPDMATIGPYTQSDLILGLATLQRLRIYIAYGRHKLFLTAAAGPPAMNPLPSDTPAPAELPPAADKQPEIGTRQ